MNEANFETEIRRVYKNAIVRQRAQPELIRVPFVVYIADPAQNSQVRSSTTAASLRRATVARIQSATEEISARLREDPPELAENERIGDVAMNLWARQRARNPNPEIDPVLPQSNVFRQAMRVDFLRETAPQRQGALEEYFDVPFEVLTTQPGTIRLHVPSLRQALGLPPYPLFARDILTVSAPPLWQL